MGGESEFRFKLKRLPKIAIICAGTTKEDQIKRILKLFNSAQFLGYHGIGRSYLVRYKKKSFMMLFDLLGSVASELCIRALHDGGCKKAIFIGWAGSASTLLPDKPDLEIGSFLLPKRVGCFDGLVSTLNPRIKYVYPHKNLLDKLKKALKGSLVSQSISVPTPNLEYKKRPWIRKRIAGFNPFAIEIESASFLHFAKVLGIQAAGILIISDNKREGYHLTEKARNQAQITAIKTAAEIL